jgi:hypothetical protein
MGILIILLICLEVVHHLVKLWVLLPKKCLVDKGYKENIN